MARKKWLLDLAPRALEYVGGRLKKTFPNAIPNNNMDLLQHFQFVCLNIGNKPVVREA